MSNTNKPNLVDDVRVRKLSNIDLLSKDKNVVNYNKNISNNNTVNIINMSAEIKSRIKNSTRNIKSKQLNEIDE